MGGHNFTATVDTKDCLETLQARSAQLHAMAAAQTEQVVQAGMIPPMVEPALLGAEEALDRWKIIMRQ